MTIVRIGTPWADFAGTVAASENSCLWVREPVSPLVIDVILTRAGAKYERPSAIDSDASQSSARREL